MKLLSFRNGDVESYGAVVDDGIVDLGARVGSSWATIRSALEAEAVAELAELAANTPVDLSLDEVTILPPVQDADKVLAVGRNYRDHVTETESDLPEHPRVFLKHASAIVGHDEPIVRPRASEKFDYEGELVAIIGRRGRHVSPADALSFVAGYSCFNDGSVRDYQRHGITAGKNFSRSSSFGPWMVTSDEIPDPTKLELSTRVNDQEVQRSTTDLLIFDIPFLISYISTWMELLPGDAIVTGTPGGVGSRREPPLWLKADDVVEVEVSRIGVLRNSVVDD